MHTTKSAEEGFGYYRRPLDYRARVSRLYADAHRGSGSDAERLEDFRAGRDRLLATHPHSPLRADDRTTFAGLSYYPYNRRLRFTPSVEPDPRRTILELDGMSCERVGWVEFVVDGTPCRLALLWIRGYAGGLFPPFADATTGSETFAGGRYVWDSLKGADLGFEGDRIVVDFNYACHPPSAYDPGLARPAPPDENRLEVAIRAGGGSPPCTPCARSGADRDHPPLPGSAAPEPVQRRRRMQPVPPGGRTDVARSTTLPSVPQGDRTGPKPRGDASPTSQ